MRTAILAVLFATCVVFQISADTAVRPKRVYHTARLTQQPPKIDGVLSDDVWKSSYGWQGDFLLCAPNEGQPATARPTRFKIVYDNDNIYVAIQCYDDPTKVKKIFTPRDQSDNSGDLCGIAFDSYFNHTTAYEFDLTAAGQKVDVMYVGGGNNYNFNWNAVWDGATAINDSGWAAEFKIPFSQLRYNNLKEQVWGLHVWRQIDRLNEQSMWNLIPANVYQGAHNFGEIHGISDIRCSRQTEFLPYLSLKYDNNNQNQNPFVKDGQWVFNGGLDAKIGISSNFTLDATINPDFGQIEQDPAILNLTEYETYFDEKRPFFLEGTEIFDFNPQDAINGSKRQLFYSRRIGETSDFYPALGDNEMYQPPGNTAIIGSGKLTGRTQNGLSVGILDAVTNSENGTIFGIDSISNSPYSNGVLAQPYTNYLAGRVKKESPDANTEIGGSFNSVAREFDRDSLRNQMVSSANTMGIDFKQMFLDKKYSLQANVMGSLLDGSHQAITIRQESDLHEYQRPDAKGLSLDTTKSLLSGEGAFLEIAKQEGFFQFWAIESCWSPGLDVNDIGYMRETDKIDQQLLMGLFDTTPLGFFSQIKGYFFTDNAWTFEHEHTQSVLGIFCWSMLKNLWTIQCQGYRFFPSLDTRILRGGPALYQDGYNSGYLSVQTDQSQRINAQIQTTYNFNIHDNDYAGHYELTLNLNPIDKLNFSGDIGFDKNNMPYQYVPASLPDGINVVGRLKQEIVSLTLRASFYVNPKLSFQYYGNPYFTSVDYSDFRRVASPHSANVNDRFHVFTGSDLSFSPSDNSYSVNEPGMPSYSFANPDELYRVFQSNFVFKWEYLPGSTLYFVWTHNQGKDDFYDAPRLDDNSLDVLKTASRDVFMVKLSYWFSL
jgi:hypothetical protein